MTGGFRKELRYYLVRIGLFILFWSLFPHSALAPPSTLNLSQDLVSLGIAASNMTPDQPSLDSGPLLDLGLAYAVAHQYSRVIADPGAYYFLSLEGNTHRQLDFVSNLTMDFQGSNLILTHPNRYGIILFGNTNVVFENFTMDYDPLPFTQLRVVAVDTANARIQYSVEPGWRNPSSLNSLGAPVFEVHLFRYGREAPGTRLMATQAPFSGNTITILDLYGFTPTPENMATVRVGDVMVVAARDGSAGNIITDRCTGCTLRNITFYSSANAAIDSKFTKTTVWERVYSVPKPGTDRLVSTFGFGLMARGPGNEIRLSRAIRSLDGGFALYTWAAAEVESQQSARTLTAAGVGAGAMHLGGGLTLPNGSPVVFQRRSDGAILASAVLVSQSGFPDGINYNANTLIYTFDRDLPNNLVGAVIYTTDVNLRGEVQYSNAIRCSTRVVVLEWTSGAGRAARCAATISIGSALQALAASKASRKTIGPLRLWWTWFSRITSWMGQKPYPLGTCMEWAPLRW
jgi:hypothetical protein